MDSKRTEAKDHEFVTISMRPELAQRARVQAALAGVSRSAYIRRALAAYMMGNGATLAEGDGGQAVNHEPQN